MTAYAHNSGGTINWDTLITPSVNATLDTHTISNRTVLKINTDSYLCANHSQSAGSLDTVSFSGTGGKLLLDGTAVRVVAFTGGSGTVPAIGTTVSNNGASAYFLGVWTDWQSEPTASGAAMPATGYIKVRDITGGTFSASAFTAGITATSSEADRPGWIEIRGADTATIGSGRVSEFEVIGDWFDLGSTNGSAGQVLPCPTTATVAGVFAGVWIETAAGSGVYERFAGCGSMVNSASTPTDVRGKIVWQTTSGIRIGSDGVNTVGFLPPTGCKVRIPNVILTCCTRTAGGSGLRVLPNATNTTRQEFAGTNGVYKFNYAVCQWATSLFPLSLQVAHCVFNDFLAFQNSALAVSVDDFIIAPTQVQVSSNRPLYTVGNKAGGNISNGLAYRASYNTNIVSAISQYNIGIIHDNVTYATLTNRVSNGAGTIQSTYDFDCQWLNCTFIGAQMQISSCRNILLQNMKFADCFSGTTLTTNAISIMTVSGGEDITIDGLSFMGLTNVHPYSSLFNVASCLNFKVKNIGTQASPLSLGSVNPTLYMLTSGVNNTGMVFQRVYISNTATGISNASWGDNIEYINVRADFADTQPLNSTNGKIKGCGWTPALSGVSGVFGSHFIDNFSSATVGAISFCGNEPNALSASELVVTSGSALYTGLGGVKLVTVGDQVTWTMPYFAIAHTALANAAPSLVGTNTGNLTYEFQYDLGTGYNGSWLTLNAANLNGVGAINPATGIRLKIRATCATANANNDLVNISIATVTTSAAQSANLYPLNSAQITLNGLIAGTRVQIYNMDTAQEVYNGVPGTTLTTSLSFDTDPLIRVRAMYQSGVTAKLFEEFTETLTAAGFSRTVAQLDDVVYITNAVDGSAITTITIDDTNLLVEVDSGTISWADIYAYESYWLTTEIGIRDEGRFIDAVDVANYTLTDFKIKNVSSPSVPLMITGGYGIDSVTGTAAALIDNTGGTIFCTPGHVVSYAVPATVSAADVWGHASRSLTSVANIQSGLATEAQATANKNAVIAAIPAPPTESAIADAILAAAAITPIVADVQKMNASEVIGTGTTGDAWRGAGVSP